MKKLVKSLLDAHLASFSDTPPAKLNDSLCLVSKNTRSSYLTRLIVISILKDGLLNNDNIHYDESWQNEFQMKGNMAAAAA